MRHRPNRRERRAADPAVQARARSYLPDPLRLRINNLSARLRAALEEGRKDAAASLRLELAKLSSQLYGDAEPPEPSGEAFRGNEAAAFLAESQARAQRLK